MTGNIIRTSVVDVDLSRIKEVAESFIGGYEQLPMYSAVKVNGKRLMNWQDWEKK